MIPLNKRVSDMPFSATLACNEMCDKALCGEKTVFKLCFGKSPFPIPQEIVEVLQTHASKNDYLPVRGLPELREAAAAHLARTQGVGRSAEDVLVGPGTKELWFILQLVCDADILVPTPSWVSYALQGHILGSRLVRLPTSHETNWLPSAAMLDEVCRRDPDRARMLVVNSPSNPAGAAFTADNLSELTAVARKYGVVIVSDEIYGDLHHEGKHLSPVRSYPEGTIVSSGLSKWCGAGGWRLGLFNFPPQLRPILDGMAAVAAETYTSASSPVQYAAATAYGGGPVVEAYLAGSRRLLSALGGHLAHKLRASGVRLTEPRGAYYMFPDFSPLAPVLATRGIRTDRELCDRLLKESGVANLPGSDFGMPLDTLTARLAYVHFDGATALSNACALPDAEVLGTDFLRANCKPIIDAVNTLAAWLDSL